jgi:hypothetical protein
MPNCLQATRTNDEEDWQSDQPENRDDSTNLLPPGHSTFLLTNHTKQHHHNNCSSDKQSNSQTFIPLAAIPDKEACYQQRNGETPDNNAKCYLSN